jgi:hypothetical protein
MSRENENRNSFFKRNSFLIALVLVCLLSCIFLGGTVAYSLWSDKQIANSSKYISAEEVIDDGSVCSTDVVASEEVIAEADQKSDNESKDESSEEKKEETATNEKSESSKDSGSNRDDSRKSSTENSGQSATSTEPGGTQKSDSSSTPTEIEKIWVEPVYKTVHHEAVTQTVTKYVCNDERNGYTCHAEFDSAEAFYNQHKLPTGG